MRRSVPVILMVFSLFVGCRAKELSDKAAISRDLDKRGTTDLLKQVADDKYNPPADGKLAESQVQMYLKVRDHEKQIAQVARQEAQQHADAAKKAGDKSLSGMMEGFKTLGSVADLATADIRAAKDLGYNTQEYLWVKGKILEASSAAAAEKMTQATQASLEASYSQIKKSYEEAKDEATKKAYSDMLAGMEKSKQEMGSQQKMDPSTAYNLQLISKYENSLNALTAELTKWSDKPEDAQKWQQNIENANKPQAKP